MSSLYKNYFIIEESTLRYMKEFDPFYKFCLKLNVIQRKYVTKVKGVLWKSFFNSDKMQWSSPRLLEQHEEGRLVQLKRKQLMRCNKSRANLS